MKKMYPVVHFEMPAEDRQRMVNFYSRVFGWQAQFFGEDMGNYVTVSTTETDEKGMIKNPGAINGGFYPKREDPLGQRTSLVIAVDDINESSREVNEAGGKIQGEPVDIPGVGKYVSFLDTEGNVLSLLQPLPR
jgi:predicted enzyme related to lactoylglutathione lyase